MAADVSDSVANIAMTVMGVVILCFGFIIIIAHIDLSFLIGLVSCFLGCEVNRVTVDL